MATAGTMPTPLGFAGPLYAQVAAILRTKISTAEWTAKAPIPNEVALAKTIGVSIGTMRKALEMLEDERLIQRQQGRGTFVVESSDETELERFSNLTLKGDKFRAKLISRTRALHEAGPDDMARLRIAAGAPVTRIDTIWAGDKGFRAHERATVAQAVCPGLETQDVGIGQVLFPVYRRQYRILISRAQEQVSSLIAGPEWEKVLGIPATQALLRIDRVAYDGMGTPVEWSCRHVHLADVSYSVSMG